MKKQDHFETLTQDQLTQTTGGFDIMSMMKMLPSLLGSGGSEAKSGGGDILSSLMGGLGK